MKKKFLGISLAAIAAAALIPVTALADQEPAEAPILETELHIKYLNGYSDGTFKPDSPIKRSEACKLIAGLLKSKNEGGDYLFMDVPSNTWYYDAVSQLTGYDLLKGYPDGTFRPDAPITRAQFVTILSRFPHSDIETKQNFSDVPNDYWAYSAVQTAAAQGWTNGYPDGTFRPENTITRAEAVAMLNRILGRYGDQIMASTSDGIMIMPDVPDTHWAYLDMLEATTAHEYEKNGETEQWTGFDKNTSGLTEGWHNIEGELYHVNAEGQYDKNTSIDGLELDRNGRYTTGSEELDALLTAAAKKALTPGMTQEERLRAMYDYAKEQFGYLGIGTADTTKPDWDIEQATLMLKNGEGNCYSWGAGFTHLARKVGYPAKAIPGKGISPKGNESVHTWTEITIDGTPYTFDPQIESIYAKRYNEKYDLYKKEYGAAVWGYKKDETSVPDETPVTPEAPGADEELVEIISKIYGDISTEGMFQTALHNGMGSAEEGVQPLSWFIGVDELDDMEAGLASEPMINVVPHSVVLLRMKEEADIESTVTQITANADPRKWICVGVEDENFIVESAGRYILLVMDDENAKTISENFKKVFSESEGEVKPSAR